MTRPPLRIPRDRIEQLRQMLDALPAKPRTEFSARETVVALESEIRAALDDRGYTLRDIATLISSEDAPISLSTLTTALRKPRADTGAAQKPGVTGKVVLKHGANAEVRHQQEQPAAPAPTGPARS